MGRAGANSTTVSLTAGQYLPVCIFYVNAQKAAVFSLSVTRPDGKVLLDATTPSSPYLVQFSCDGQAPMFAPWGQEK